MMKYQDYVYQNFYNQINQFELENDELKNKINNPEFKVKLFHVCEMIALIGINAPKIRVEGTTHISGIFQYKDIDIAVRSVIDFIYEYRIEDIDCFLCLIESAYMYAVNEENRKKAHAAIFNDKSSMRLGEYHTFSELPDDIFENIKLYVKECIQDQKVPNSAQSPLFAND